ncbi:MAG TPA: YciI family protein [Gaiellaceae bacterium]|nr:YciI family protein [Gaiellaceae bacterium]
MQYLLLIHDDESHWSTMADDDRDKLYAEYGVFTNELRESGALVGANQLQPTSTATTVRVRDGETLTTDGPFAETKERLGGYYLIDVESLDEAIEWAAKIPTARVGTIEVRPVVPLRTPAAQG